MRVFVTGATGFIGSAIVRELHTAGHQVLGLARSDKAAELLARAGVEVHRGELSDLDSLTAAARACDGVIHTAFIHDFSQYLANAEIDRKAVEAMAGALEGSNKPIVVTSGTAGHPPGRTSTEKDAPRDPAGPRAASEVAVLKTAGRGVRASVVRLPPSVHGQGDHGFVPALIDIARRTGIAAFVGDGANHWPAVHRLDAARLFRLALEKAAPGSTFHGVAEEGIPMRAIAETIGQGLGLPVRGISADEASAHFDWMARFVQLDILTSSAITQAGLGWSPREAGLLTDMRESGYFS
ncbi:SDR family oxidoreductase [Pyxidicoccus sp. MSG2]|uniref:SDR family oxidoreductase n=1 Tax=Pyxidicoccus sp. MSG2 TaxID=2996790 RepID=UPI00226DD5F1|nr:SDR family oxidoreductase [Pyxidicoccus sp. MSG2]MCY1020074.1 SDR family oxidoreductase [Pyxidicoccus sp. MSG2]